MKRNFKSGRGIGEALLSAMGAIRGPAFVGVRGRIILNQAENILYIALQGFTFIRPELR